MKMMLCLQQLRPCPYHGPDLQVSVAGPLSHTGRANDTLMILRERIKSQGSSPESIAGDPGSVPGMRIAGQR